jgi:hypothetical protein
MLCLLLVGRNKKRKKEKINGPRAFLPKAGHVLLAVPCGIFVAVRCN